MLDGCSKPGILFKIIIPIVKPAIVTAAIFALSLIHISPNTQLRSRALSSL